jgi:hypothetical protein
MGRNIGAGKEGRYTASRTCLGLETVVEVIK